MLSRRHFPAVFVDKVIWQTAHLRTCTTVRTSSHRYKSGLTYTAIAHAQSTVHKYLYRHSGRIMASFNLIKRKLTRQYKLSESGLSKPSRLVGCTDITLSAGMQGYRRQLHLKICHILYDQGIDAGRI